MKVHEYYLSMSEDNQLNARPGQLVHASHESDTIVGFISEVDHDNSRMRFTLFDQIEYSDGMLDVVEEMSIEEVRQRLSQSLKESPDLRDMWDDIIRNSVSDDVEDR